MFPGHPQFYFHYSYEYDQNTGEVETVQCGFGWKNDNEVEAREYLLSTTGWIFNVRCISVKPWPKTKEEGVI